MVRNHADDKITECCRRFAGAVASHKPILEVKDVQGIRVDRFTTR